LKPKKSWSQQILEDESVKDEVDNQSNENEGKDINTDNQSSTEVDHEPVNVKESEDELHVYMMGRLIYVLCKLCSNCSILLLERICIGIACYPILLIYQ
jgi:hypothetical protein